MRRIIEKYRAFRRFIGSCSQITISFRQPTVCPECGAEFIMINPPKRPLRYCPDCGRLFKEGKTSAREAVRF